MGTSRSAVRRRAAIGTAVALTLGLVAGFFPLLPTPAHAAVSEPQPGETVQGIVAITEANGAVGGNGCINAGTVYSRIEVHRLDGNGTSVEQVFSQTQNGGTSGAGPIAQGFGNSPWTANWNSVGHPNGAYRIQSFLRNSTSTSTAAGTCANGLQNEIVHSDFVVNLENRSAAVVLAPESQPTGEPLPLLITTVAESTDIPLSDVKVSIDIPGVGTETVTTDENGEATLVVDLPDLPAGTLSIDATTADDPPAFAGSTQSTSTELTHRSTQTTWDGDLRGDAGNSATLAATVLDATPESDRMGTPLADVDVDLTFEGNTVQATTNDGGRASASSGRLEGPDRAVPASAEFGGNEVFSPSGDSIEFFISDDAAQTMPHNHSTVGGITRMAGGLLSNLSGAVRSVGTFVSQLLPLQDDPVMPLVDAVDDVVGLLPLEDVDAALAPLTEPVGDVVGPLGDPVDEVLGDVLAIVGTVLVELSPLLPDELGLIGTVLSNPSFEWQTIYATPGGQHQRFSFGALIGIPEPLDVTGDGRTDVMANLTVIPDGSDILVSPRIRVDKLPGAPEALPLSIQAVLGFDDLIPLGDGRLRVGYDSRQSSAPEAFQADLGLASGGFQVTLGTRGAQDLALTGAFEGEGFSLPFGAPDAPSFDDPISEPSNVGSAETRFAVSFQPAPEHTEINLGLGGSGGALGATFETSRPSNIGLSFVQDSGTSEVFALDAVFQTVNRRMALALGAGSSGGGLAPELSLNFSSDQPMDTVALQGRGYLGGQVISDLLLSLTDVPRSLTFGVDPDGGLGLNASSPVGVMEAGFASGGPVAQLDEEAFVYMTSSDGFESVAIRLLGVESMSAALSETIGLTLVMAPTPLRAVVDSDQLGLDAKIYDAPGVFSLGLAADGSFLIDGNAPIDLITLNISDESGIFLGATDIDVRMEEINGPLQVLVGEEGATFDASPGSIGLFLISATSTGEPIALPEGQDALILILNTQEGSEEFALGARLTGLQRIVAALEGGAPSFQLDTLAERVLNLDLNVAGLEISGQIDHLVPGMRMGVAADEEGNLTGLAYEASRATNSMDFDIPGFASLNAHSPLPSVMELGISPDGSMRVFGSEYFTLDLVAELEFGGDIVNATMTNFRVKMMEFGFAEIEDPPGGFDEVLGLFANTTEFSDECPEGCVWPLAPADPTFGTLVIGPIPEFLGGTVTFTPRGMSATNALVTMGMTIQEIFGIPVGATVTHVNTDGDMHCTGTNQNNGTNLSAFVLIITVQMRNGLCGGSTDRADLEFSEVNAPADVIAGDGDLTHSVTVTNNGPNGSATNLTITAEDNLALGDPVGFECPGGGTPSDTEVACTWPGATAVGATRTMEVSWDTTDAEGLTLEVDYTASSDTSGNEATASATTSVHDGVANLEITDLQAQDTVVAGQEDVVHRVEARNNGPSDAENLGIGVDHNGELGDPEVTCDEGGTASSDGCVWEGGTAPAGEVWAEFTYAAPEGTSSRTLEATYEVSSDTAGASDSASATTEVIERVANLAFVEAEGSERVLPGEDVVHTVTVANTGPSAGDSVRILADHDASQGDPSVTCSDGGVVHMFSEIDRARCLWLGDTEVDGERTMELVWSTDPDTENGTNFEVSYRATSNTPGDDAFASVSTLIDIPEQADIEITDVSGPEVLGTPGNNVVHSVSATNNGPHAATDLTIVADHTGLGVVPGDPIDVTCPGGGSSTVVALQVTCVWETTNPEQTRTMTLTWDSAAAEASGPGAVLDIGYEAFSATNGTGDEASASTTLVAAEANLAVTGQTGHPFWASGGTAGANSLIHSLTVTNNGPDPATTVQIVANHSGMAGNPTTLACGGGGTPDNTQAGVATCTYAGNTNAGASRTMTLTWNGGAVTAAGVGALLEIEYEATSATPGSNATASAQTEINSAAANLTVTGGTAPATVDAGESFSQSASVARNGTHPSGAAGTAVNLRIGAVTTGLGNPTGISCSTGGTSLFPAEFACQWNGNTTTQTRTLTATWNAAATLGAADGTVVETQFTGSSDTPGTVAEVTRTTTVAGGDAGLEVVSVIAPPEATTGSTLVHRATATSSGPAPAHALQMVATHNELLGDPDVTCSGVLGGETAATSSVSPGEASCTWPGNTAVGRNRTITLEWPVGLTETPGSNLEIAYEASSLTSGLGATAGPVFTTITEQADLEASLTAPSEVVAGTDLVHRLDAENAGPSNATGLRIDFAHNGNLGEPSVECSADGVADGEACLWAGPTGPSAGRWVELTWPVDAGEAAGTVLEASYEVSSATPGSGDSAQGSTEVTATADLLLVDVLGPDTATAGSNPVHTVTAENVGPSVASGMRIDAFHSGEFGDPLVACSNGGTVSHNPEGFSCNWASTAPGVQRTMTVTWSVPSGAEVGELLDIEYHTASDTPGAQDDSLKPIEVV